MDNLLSIGSKEPIRSQSCSGNVALSKATQKNATVVKQSKCKKCANCKSQKAKARSSRIGVWLKAFQGTVDF